MLAQLSVWFFKDRKIPIAIPIGLVFFFLAFCAYLQVDTYGVKVPLFNYAERLSIYSRYMKWWTSAWPFVVFGVGPGTFMWMSLLIDKFTPPLFLQMHSDWLQVLFELGIVGALLAIVSYVRALARAKNDTAQLAAVVGIGAFALTYHLFRFFPPAVLVVMILLRGVRKGWKEEGSDLSRTL